MRFALLLIALLSAGQSAYGDQAVTRTAIVKKTYNCPDGQFYDQRTNQCLGALNQNAICPDGYQYDPASTLCQLMVQKCPPGSIYNGETDACVQNVDSARISNLKGCPPGYVLVPSTGLCALPADIPATGTVVPTPTATTLPLNNRNMQMEYTTPVTPVTVINPKVTPMHNIAMPEYTGSGASTSPWTVTNAAANPTPTRTLTGTDGNTDGGPMNHGMGLTLSDGAPPNNAITHNTPMPGYLYGR